MRLFAFLVLLAVVGVIVIFAVQNQQDVTLTFFKTNITASVAAVIGATYVLGMCSGWTIMGLLRRSFERATDFHRQQPAAPR